MIRACGRRAETVRADIRDIAALRRIADQTDQQFGKIDVEVANAAIQRWKPLLEMEDSDWRDVIDNNLNGAANTIRAFAPRWSRKRKAGSLSSPRCRASMARKTPRAIRPPNLAGRCVPRIRRRQPRDRRRIRGDGRRQRQGYLRFHRPRLRRSSGSNSCRDTLQRAPSVSQATVPAS